MLLYGVCISDIKNVKLEGVKDLMKALDIYDTCMEDCDNDDSNILEWVDNYETEGRYGLGALLYDAMTEKEPYNVSIDDPDGLTYIGLSLDLPWKYNNVTKTMQEDEYHAMLSKYIVKVTDESLDIKIWNINDEAGY